MARAVIWRPEARADLREINAYVAVRSPSGARRVVERIKDAASNSRHFPYSNRMIPEFQDPDRRETFVYACRCTASSRAAFASFASCTASAFSRMYRGVSRRGRKKNTARHEQRPGPCALAGRLPDTPVAGTNALSPDFDLSLTCS
jgi:plasmid stabilization system protein ParE